MIVFQSRDKKALKLIEKLALLGIEGYALNPRISILYPVRLLILLIKGKKIRIYVFRYLNDSKNLIISLLYLLSDLITILILNIFKIKIFWLCHNVDKETHQHYPYITKLRRNNISKHAKIIFTTNELLVPKAKELFPRNIIDYISLGYIEGGIHKKEIDIKSQTDIQNWILEHKKEKSKFIFCIGQPATKSLHFTHIYNFITELNKNSKLNWYGIVVGGVVKESKYIFNIPHTSILDEIFIKKNADYFYRIIDDYSMSYSTYEAVHLRIPIITEKYGILPSLITKYKIGITIENYNNIEKSILKYNQDDTMFHLFETKNNWHISANKLKFYYDMF